MASTRVRKSTPKAPSKAAASPRKVTKTSRIRVKEESIPRYRDVEDEIRETRSRLADVLKRSSDRRRSSHRRRPLVDETDIETEYEVPMRSFRHAKGTRPYLDHSFRRQFPHVDGKYFKQIFYGTFRPENLTKLAPLYLGIYRAATGDKVQDEVIDMVHLLACIEVYSQAIVHFACPTVAPRLQEALSYFRVRLSEMSIRHEFDSVRKFCYDFIYHRIWTGQDDPPAWTDMGDPYFDLLVRRDQPSETSW